RSPVPSGKARSALAVSRSPNSSSVIAHPSAPALRNSLATTAGASVMVEGCIAESLCRLFLLFFDYPHGVYVNMKFIRSLVLLTAAAMMPSSAQAAPITFNFTVRVTELVGSASTLFPTLAAGDTIVGQYTFDGASLDTVPASPVFGSY